MCKDGLEVGKRGEQVAAHYLLKKGYKIEATNYRCPIGEIDIIAREGGILVFVEVKTRKNELYGHAVESVNYKKQLRLNRVALYYLVYSKQRSGQMCRFDVVAVAPNQTNGWSVDLIKDAFPFIDNQ